MASGGDGLMGTGLHMSVWSDTGRRQLFGGEMCAWIGGYGQQGCVLLCRRVCPEVWEACLGAVAGWWPMEVAGQQGRKSWYQIGTGRNMSPYILGPQATLWQAGRWRAAALGATPALSTKPVHGHRVACMTGSSGPGGGGVRAVAWMAGACRRGSG